MPAEEPPTIDTSKMPAGRRAAIELTEAARTVSHGKTFAAGLFMGESSGIRQISRNYRSAVAASQASGRIAAARQARFLR